MLALSWLWSCLVVPLAACSCHENLNWVWICGKSLVKAWIKHIHVVVAKTIIKPEVVAKASIFITFSYEKNNLAPILSEKKNMAQTKIPGPQNIKWTVPKLSLNCPRLWTKKDICIYLYVLKRLLNVRHTLEKSFVNATQFRRNFRKTNKSWIEVCWKFCS